MNKGLAATAEDLKFLFITSGLVVLMGVTAFGSFASDFNDPSTSTTEASFQESETAATYAQSASRMIASIATGGADATQSKPELVSSHSSLDVSFRCKDRAPASAFQVGSGLLQLKGKICGDSAIKILNLSNGYTATLFQQAGRYTSDFIQLASGKNLIELQSQGFTQKIEVEYLP